LPDKTPFFEDLENQLMQSEVTLATAEAAYLRYLEKLDQVARLEIVGMYRQRSAADAGVDVLHVFGRTYNQPHIYFHRALDNEVWSPWTKVDLDIQGNHLIPVVHNRRLHVF